MLLLFTLTLFANIASTAPDVLSLTFMEVLPPGVFLHLSPFPSEGRDAFGMSRDAFVCFPRFFLPFRSTWSSIEIVICFSFPLYFFPSLSLSFPLSLFFLSLSLFSLSLFPSLSLSLFMLYCLFGLHRPIHLFPLITTC